MEQEPQKPQDPNDLGSLDSINKQGCTLNVLIAVTVAAIATSAAQLIVPYGSSEIGQRVKDGAIMFCCTGLSMSMMAFGLGWLVVKAHEKSPTNHV